MLREPGTLKNDSRPVLKLLYALSILQLMDSEVRNQSVKKKKKLATTRALAKTHRLHNRPVTLTCYIKFP